MNKLKRIKHFLFITQIRFGNFFLEKLRKKTYHVIGDSHSLNFLSPYFIIHHIGPATAYRLNSNKSTTMSKKKTMEILNRIYKGRKINVIFVFGELDARIHIYKISKEKKISITKLIKATVEEYIHFVDIIKKKYPLINIYIFNVMPTGEEGNIYRFSYYPRRKQRKKIVYLINEELRKKCKEKSYKFIYIFPKLVTSKGNRKKEYIFDKVHFNRKILPFITAEINFLNNNR